MGVGQPSGRQQSNTKPGATVANGAIVGITSSRKFAIYNNAGSVDFLIDVNGRFGPADVSAVQVRKASDFQSPSSGKQSRSSEPQR